MKPLSRHSIEITSASAVEHVLGHRPDRIRQLLLSRRGGHRIQTLRAMAEAHGIPVHLTDDLAGENVRASLAPFEYADLGPFLETLAGPGPAVVLALDHLQDPQNFGALCRTAEGFGVKGVLVPKDRAVPVGAGVYHASVGAVETVPIVQVTNLGESLRKLKDAGFWAVAATLGEGATAPWEAPDFEKVVLVLGTELEGISPGVEKACDWKVRIPLSGRVQSLNVSAAGAALMYEWIRRARRP